MKKILFTILACFITLNSWSQVGAFDNEKFSILDHANYRFTYKLKFIPDKKKRNSVEESLHVLLIGSNYSKFFNALYEEKVDKTKDYVKNIDNRGIGSIEVFKNNKTGKMTVIQMEMIGKWEYESPIPNIDWKITNDTKIIQGYKCQKALCSYLGRSYEAWFTPEIAIKNGPWKFGNLPGLILDVADTEGDYSFTCIGIEKSKKSDPIVKYTVKTEKIERKKLNKIIERFYADPVTFFEITTGNKVKVRIKNGTTFQNAPQNYKASFPYNPIELE